MKVSSKYIFIFALIAGILYQVMCAVFGFDMSDEGFLMTLYRDFGDGFDARKTGSGYPIACAIGNYCAQLTPHSLLAMRLWGIGMITVLFVIIYVFLKDKFNLPLVALGLFAMTMVMGNDPKPLGYNNITGFISVIAMISIIHGCINDKWYCLAVGGLFIGFNIFVRLPNILDVCFAAIPFIAYDTKSWREQDFRKSFSQMCVVIFGCILGGVIGWQILRYTGADENVIAFLGTITGQLGGDSTHSSSSMLKRLGLNYWQVIVHTALYIAILLLIPLVSRLKKPWGILISALLLYLLYRTRYLGANTLGLVIFALINGIGIVGCVTVALYGNRKQRVIGLAAILMSVVMPLGSDQGFVTMWNGTWFSFPIGLCGMQLFLKNIRIYLDSHDVRLRMFHRSLRIKMSEKACKCSLAMTTLVVLLIIGVKVYLNCYYDPGARFDKVCSIDSSYAEGIYTDKSKADRFNPLLEEMRKYVSGGDSIIVYDWSPMLYCLTDTKPYAGVSWPCVYYGQAYVDEIDKQEKKSSKLPVVILQNYRAVGKLYSRYFFPENADDNSEMVMIECINNFIVRHKYRIVWSNGWFEILLPPDKTTLQQPSHDW